MEKVDEFEYLIANFYGSPYAVAVDCCTHGIELCLRMLDIKQATCPRHTYLSVPMTFEKLGIDWNFTHEEWVKYYKIGDTNIYDAAVLWEPESYIPNSLMVLSFQFKKHLSLNKGGMILLDDKHKANLLKKMRYDGRDPGVLWKEQDISIMGYHYYMTTETAQLGIDKFHDAAVRESKIWSWTDYPDLSKMRVFR